MTRLTFWNCACSAKSALDFCCMDQGDGVGSRHERSGSRNRVVERMNGGGVEKKTEKDSALGQYREIESIVVVVRTHTEIDR